MMPPDDRDRKAAEAFVKELNVSLGKSESGFEISMVIGERAYDVMAQQRREGELAVARWLRGTGTNADRFLATMIEKGLPSVE